MRVDPLELEVAFDLVDLVDTSRGGDLLDRVKALRRKVAMETGLVIPLVRTRDNLDLPASTYVIWLNGVPAARGISPAGTGDRKSTRLNSSHANISYAVFCLKKKNMHQANGYVDESCRSQVFNMLVIVRFVFFFK